MQKLLNFILLAFALLHLLKMSVAQNHLWFFIFETLFNHYLQRDKKMHQSAAETY